MFKRKYGKKLIAALEKNNEFLIDNLRREWEESQKIVKRKEQAEKIVAMAKKSGAALGKIILGMALVSGVLIVAMVAPKVFVVFGRSNKAGKRYKYFFDEQNFRKTIKKLKFKKYIKVVKKDENKEGAIFEICLEKQGSQKVVRESFGDLTITKPAQWDGVWRIVVFDIPERHKWAREGFRDKLKQLNFYQIQDSVFAFPYDCRREIEFICSVFSISDYIRYLEVKTLFFDNDLRDFYGIK